MGQMETFTFRNEDGEAVRLPEAVAFGRNVRLTVVRSGDVVTMYPSRPSVSDLISRLSSLPRPETVEVRDTTDIEERLG